MSNMLPFVNNSELSVQFFGTALNGHAIQSWKGSLAGAAGTAVDTTNYRTFLAGSKCKLHLRWYQLPLNMRLNDVYDIGG